MNTVDQLGQVKAQIANLQQLERELKQNLIATSIDSGETIIEGDLFRVRVYQSENTRVDWKAIAAKLEPSRQLVTAHTSTATVDVVRCSARKTS